jgi:hypothetical protein
MEVEDSRGPFVNVNYAVHSAVRNALRFDARGNDMFSKSCVYWIKLNML